MFSAFGAHGLAKYDKDKSTQRNWQTASQYQLEHSGMALMALMKSPHNQRAAVFFMLGNVLFSGSIYLLSVRQIVRQTSNEGAKSSQAELEAPPQKSLLWTICGVLTPIGGLFYVAGWLWLAIL